MRFFLKKDQKSAVEIIFLWRTNARHVTGTEVWFGKPVGLLCRKLTLSFLSSCRLQIDSSVWIEAPASFTLSVTAVTLSGLNLCRLSVCLYSLSEFICVSCVWKPCFHSLVSSTPFDSNYLVATSFAGILESREERVWWRQPV